MMFETWEELKRGKILYLSGRQKVLLDEYVTTRNEIQRKYYARCFKFTIDPDDRERSTYECSCTKTFDEFVNKIKADRQEIRKSAETFLEQEEPILKDDFLEEKPDPAVQMKLETVLTMIKSMEDAMNVSVLARGGSYGGARLVIRDNKTDEEITRE